MMFSRFTQKSHYLQIQAADVLCCLPLDRVHKIFSLMALTPVLGSPGYLAGVFNFHGNIVPVLDLSLRLGQPATENYSSNTCVIVCHTFENDAYLGLIVSTVGSIIELSRDELQLAPQFAGRTSPFSAVHQQQTNVCFVLNTDALLNSSLTQLYSLSPEEINQMIKTEFTFNE
jgi:purine-binding chemotaxis protein CheW